MNEFSEKGSDFVRDLSDAARKNPISAALIGMGVLWLFTGGRTAERVGSWYAVPAWTAFPMPPEMHWMPRVRRCDQAAKRSAAASLTRQRGFVGNRKRFEMPVRAGLDRVARAGSEVAGAAYGYAQNIPDAGGALFSTARENLSELFRAQPLALGAVGLAIGAGIAAALPATDLEAEYFGEASDNFKEQAVDFASEQVSRAATVAEDVVTAVSDEARKQGLTLDAAKSAIADIPAKLGRVVDAAGKGISDRVTSTTP